MDHATSSAEMAAQRQKESADAAAEYRLKCAATPHVLDLFRALEEMARMFPNEARFLDADSIISKIKANA